ncbi:MAG: hypothetical protein WBF87_06985 [Mesorhizobium sp.]
MESNNIRPGFFRSALNSLIEARTRQASRYVASALLTLDDKTLEAHGYSRAELQKRGQSGFPF